MKTDSAERDSDQSSVSSEDSWIFKFVSAKENRCLARLQDSFLQDKFNYYGIKEKLSSFDESYLAIVDKAGSTDAEAEAMLYYLIHQRYIMTKPGLEDIMGKVLNRDFGTCYRIGCRDVPFIPIGVSNELKKSKTKLYCYNCGNLYEPRSSIKRLDGAAWGTSFAHLLIMMYPYHFEKIKTEPYVPRIFGFQIAEPEDCDSS